MKFEHATIQIEEPAPGHYSVSGIPVSQVFVEGTGHVVAPNNLYISPAVPDELLEHILADRRAQQKSKPAKETKTLLEKAPETIPVDQDTPVSHSEPLERAPREVAPEAHTTEPAKPRRGRPAKAAKHH